MGEENYLFHHVKQQKIYKYITNTEMLSLLSTGWIPSYPFEKDFLDGIVTISEGYQFKRERT